MIWAGGEAGQLYRVARRRGRGGRAGARVRARAGRRRRRPARGVRLQRRLAVRATTATAVRRVVHGLGFPNWPAFAPDGTLFVSDSGALGRRRRPARADRRRRRASRRSRARSRTSPTAARCRRTAAGCGWSSPTSRSSRASTSQTGRARGGHRAARHGARRDRVHRRRRRADLLLPAGPHLPPRRAPGTSRSSPRIRRGRCSARRPTSASSGRGSTAWCARTSAAGT